MKDFKDVIILVLIAAVAGATLSFVYAATKDKIAEAKRRELESALKKVMPFMDTGFSETTFSYQQDGKQVETSIPIYIVTDDETLKGAALEMVTSEGYGGDIRFLMGVNSDGQITGFYILEHKETPGLGTKASDKKFYGQFLGKKLISYRFKVEKDGGDVDAITAATITSRAITHAMERGLKIFEAFKNERGEV